MKNRILLSFCGLMLGLSPALSLAQVPPTTQPAAVAGINLKMSRVEVFAFSPVNAGQGDWIGKGIQESLQTDISRTGATLLLPTGSPVGNDAMAVAKQNHADLAVIGSYQTAGDDIRVTGHLVDVADGSTLGSFAATGPARNLFTIEDALGEQLRRLLPASPVAQQMNPVTVPQPAEPVGAAAPAPTVVYAQAPQAAYPPPTVNYYYDNSQSYVPDYDYAYPSYVAAYPLGFYGVGGIYGGGYYSGGYYGRAYSRGFDHGFGNRGFGDRGFIGGGFAGGRSFGAGSAVGTARGFGGIPHSGFGGSRGFGGGGHGGMGGGHVGGGHR